MIMALTMIPSYGSPLFPECAPANRFHWRPEVRSLWTEEESSVAERTGDEVMSMLSEGVWLVSFMVVLAEDMVGVSDMISKRDPIFSCA